MQYLIGWQLNFKLLKVISEENKTLQSLWLHGNFSNNELLGMYSYLYHGHEFDLYTYSDKLKNLPKGVRLKDANKIIPSSKIFKDSAGSFAAFADWFRFQLLYNKGGWWVDLDTVCLQPLDIEEKYCFSTERDSLGNVLINATCIKAKKESVFLSECLDFIDKRENKNIPFGEFGLSLYRKVLRRYEYIDFIKPPEAFCPINWFNLSNLITFYNYTPSENTFTIHLWNEMWRRGCLDKNATYHPGSIYERLKRKYLNMKNK